MNLTAYSNENVEYVDNIENKKDMQLLNEFAKLVAFLTSTISTV